MAHDGPAAPSPIAATHPLVGHALIAGEVTQRNDWHRLPGRNHELADSTMRFGGSRLKAAGAERIYSDVGSGKKGAVRPNWEELLRSLRPDDTLMVTELSRLGRSTSQLSSLADELAARSIALRILNLGIDTATSGGKLIYTVISGVAEMERDLLIERTNSGLAAARARGRKGGRKREFSPAAVRRAQDQYDKGDLSVSEIARLAGVSRQTLYRYLDVGSREAKA